MVVMLFFMATSDLRSGSALPVAPNSACSLSHMLTLKCGARDVAEASVRRFIRCFERAMV